jgi:hypothetical protein
MEIISNPYLEQSIHVGKVILKNFNSNWTSNDLDLYGDDFKKQWTDKNYDK